MNTIAVVHFELWYVACLSVKYERRLKPYCKWVDATSEGDVLQAETCWVFNKL
jgi:hypothetical protein